MNEGESLAAELAMDDTNETTNENHNTDFDF